ncbi:hypothetical protein RUM44_013313 [Polyplax serrata]|uniref:SET domain-containing protein n=1 Tax=Polyplax serrata TaxID=468196 RepID=A0ABR1BDU5_POLSC
MDSLFKQHYLKLNITKDRVNEEFGQLKTDKERIEYASKVFSRSDCPPIEITKNEKDMVLSKELKESGNKLFGKGDFKGAVKKYTEAILVTPHSEDSCDLAVLIANRSASFYHLEEYESAISDVDAALLLNYPKELKYKVLERKAKSLLAVKRNKEALSEFKKTIQALDESKLVADKKLKMQNDVRLMLAVLSKSADTKKAGKNDLKEKRKQSPELCSTRNKFYPAACDKIEVKENPTAGRFASAASDISAGDTVLIEDPYCCVLLSEQYDTHCHHCFNRSAAYYPCVNCKTVRFCSFRCRDLATYHVYECPILRTLNGVGVSVTVLMSLRILTQQNLEFFLKIKPKLTESRDVGDVYDSSDYLRVYHLIRHQDRRLPLDFFERSCMAIFLTHCLKEAGYFGQENAKSDLSDEEIFIGSLLLRHLQILQFNAHEISEIALTKDNKIVDDFPSIFIGGGLYPTLALFNHSCEPGIIRSFNGTKVIVRTVKPIAAGEMVAENYGPIYSDVKLSERRKSMLTNYWFECNCIPCQENWPTIYEMDRQTLPMRCNFKAAKGKKSCQNALLLTVNDHATTVKCTACGNKHNVLKKLFEVKDFDERFYRGVKMAESGNYENALTIFNEALKLNYKFFVPPFLGIVFCQQAFRNCVCALGNSFVREETSSA